MSGWAKRNRHGNAAKIRNLARRHDEACWKILYEHEISYKPAQPCRRFGPLDLAIWRVAAFSKFVEADVGCLAARLASYGKRALLPST